MTMTDPSTSPNALPPEAPLNRQQIIASLEHFGYAADSDESYKIRQVLLIQALAEKEPWRAVAATMLQAVAEGIRPVLTNASYEFPIAWVKGDHHAFTDLREGANAAVVGARAATGYGEHVASEISAGLASRGVTIVSGGAYGIDGMAHRAALSTPGGKTVAFMAGGVDRIYPSGHQQLLTRVSETPGCALVSPFAPGLSPTRARFLARNRFMAQMVSTVVVIEAGRRSGALSTASEARWLNKPVGVVPGPITSAASMGTNALLGSRDPGVYVVTHPDDVLEVINSRGVKS